MAFDQQVFKTRALSAIVFGLIMLVALLGGKIPFFLVFGLVVVLGAREYVDLQYLIAKMVNNDALKLMYSLTALIFYIYVAHAGGFVFLDNIKLSSLAYLGPIIVLTLLWLAMIAFKKPSAALMYGYFYVPFSIGLLAQCYGIHPLLPLILIILIWINDTMQYLVGANFGKHPMAPVISPKKTWEGTIGGSLLCIIVALICGLFIKQFTILQWISFGLVASVVGTLGDLLESQLKRTAGIKDSGNIMPGHGGVLDRFDSLLLAAPVFWVVVKYILPVA
jgi:phosphatidate cytidylyltransferase